MTIQKLYKKYIKIPQEFSSIVDEKTRRAAKILFWFSMLFALIAFPPIAVWNFVDYGGIRIRVVLYYAYLLVLGLSGLLFLKLKVPSPILVLYILINSQIISFINFVNTPFSNFLIVFIGLLFSLVMILNINPLVFMVELSIFLIMLRCFAHYKLVTLIYPESSTFLLNLYLFFIIIVALVFWKRKYTIIELQKNAQLQTQKEKTNSLLQNILPDSVIDELKTQGKSPAKNYDNMSVLVSDIVDFTKTTTRLSPYFLINELNDIVSEFDKITEKYNCIRIKTIGDAYMAVCGLPEENENHAQNLLLCAQDFIAYLQERNKTAETKWNIRIGIASGSVIAGIVGKKKYLYDIFGSPVDYAVALQNACRPMHIRLAPKTYRLLQGKIKLPENIEIDSNGDEK